MNLLKPFFVLTSFLFLAGCTTVSQPPRPPGNDPAAAEPAASAAESAEPEAGGGANLAALYQRERQGGAKVTLPEITAALTASSERYKAAGETNEAAAELYADQVRASLIAMEEHGGWPVRSFLVETKDTGKQRKLRDALLRLAQNGDAVYYYAAICPTLFLKEDPAPIIASLKSADRILGHYAEEERLPHWQEAVLVFHGDEGAKDRAETRRMQEFHRAYQRENGGQ